LKNVTNRYRATTRDYESSKTSLLINVDDSEYAEGYMMIDNGTSQVSFANNEYSFWKFRYADKALNFWIERGDFKYNVSEHLKDPWFHMLDQVIILGGK